MTKRATASENPFFTSWKLITIGFLCLLFIVVLLFYSWPTLYNTFYYYSMDEAARAEYDEWLRSSPVYTPEELKVDPVSETTLKLFDDVLSQYMVTATTLNTVDGAFDGDSEAGSFVILPKTELEKVVEESQVYIDLLEGLSAQDDYQSDLWAFKGRTGNTLEFRSTARLIIARFQYQLEYKKNDSSALREIQLLTNLSYFEQPSILIHQTVSLATDSYLLSAIEQSVASDQKYIHREKYRELLNSMKVRYHSKYSNLPMQQIDNLGMIKQAYRFFPEGAVLPEDSSGPAAMKAASRLLLKKNGQNLPQEEDEWNETMTAPLFAISLPSGARIEEMQDRQSKEIERLLGLLKAQ